MIKKISKVISVIFHPVLIPTIGLFVLFNSGLYYSMLSWEAKRFIILVVFFTTSILPMLSVAVLALNPGFNLAMDKSRDKIVPLLTAAVFYYLGYLLLNKIRAFPVFKTFMLASILVIVILLLISFIWNISAHMAAIGGLTGTIFALSFRSGINPLWAIIALVIVSGLVGSSRLFLEKHTIWQVAAGYILGFAILYPVIYFV